MHNSVYILVRFTFQYSINLIFPSGHSPSSTMGYSTIEEIQN